MVDDCILEVCILPLLGLLGNEYFLVVRSASLLYGFRHRRYRALAKHETSDSCSKSSMNDTKRKRTLRSSRLFQLKQVSFTMIINENEEWISIHDYKWKRRMNISIHQFDVPIFAFYWLFFLILSYCSLFHKNIKIGSIDWFTDPIQSLQYVRLQLLMKNLFRIFRTFGRRCYMQGQVT